MTRAVFFAVAILCSTPALAQEPAAPPKAGTKQLAQAKPKVPFGCKLVGTVKGTKIWAGDCVAAPGEPEKPDQQ